MQKLKDAVGQRVIVPLHDLSGKWCFHSTKHSPGLNKDNYFFLYSPSMTSLIFGMLLDTASLHLINSAIVESYASKQRQ